MHPGNLDPAFGEAGIARPSWGSYNNVAWGMVAQPDGKAVVVGEVGASDIAGGGTCGGDCDVAVSRLTPSGDPDPSFGVNGSAFVHVSDDDDPAYSVVTDSDGNILVAGASRNAGSPWHAMLLRLSSSGTLDSSFGNGGVVLSEGADELAFALALQKDGKIVVGGLSGQQLLLARYTADGDPDESFGTSGRTTQDLGPGSDQILDIALAPNGSIVAAGTSSQSGKGDEAFVAKFTSSGAVDDAFDSDGMLWIPLSSGDDGARAVEIAASGKIVIAGNAWNGTRQQFLAARLSSTGTFDSTFGATGIVRMDASPSGGGYADDVEIQDDGRIVMAGHTGTNLAVVRLNADGSPDADFLGGAVTTSVNSGGYEQLSEAAISQGRLVAGGYSEKPDHYYEVVVLRYLLGPSEPSETSLAVKRQRTRIVATGAVSPNHAGGSVTVRFLRKRNGAFRFLAEKSAVLTSASSYTTRFSRRQSGRCRVVTLFPGDADHLKSQARRTFDC